MRFATGDLSFTATVAEVSTTQSAQSGNQLRQMTIQFRAPKEDMHELALDAAREQTRGGLFSLTDAGEVEAEWRIDAASTSYVGSAPWGIHHHTWQVEQIERLEITRLVIGEVALEPYDYVEELGDSGALRLAARAAVSDDDLERLAELELLGDAITVVREGISPDAKSMRIEGYACGRGANGRAVAIVCAELGEARVTLAGATISGGNEVLNLLVSKGIVSAEDLAELRRERMKARQVVNLDTWSL